MPYDYSLTAFIPASARDIYNAWLDSLAHSEMTGGQANISSEPGGAFSAWDGYISGRNLELVPGERIVQAWRTTKFAEDHEDSIVTITLEDRDDGALLTLSHSNVPETHLGYEQGGWDTHYFEPMIAYFTGKRGAGGGAEAEATPEPSLGTGAAPEPARPRAQRPARRPGAKRAAAKKAPKAKPKRAAAKKAAAARRKPKPKRAAAGKKPAAKKSAAKKAAAKGRRKAAARTAKPKPKGRAPKAKKAAAASRRRPAGRAGARASGARARTRRARR
jgi:uncharacterized protein YndB with AHSA1/START domain